MNVTSSGLIGFGHASYFDNLLRQLESSQPKSNYACMIYIAIDFCSMIFESVCLLWTADLIVPIFLDN